MYIDLQYGSLASLHRLRPLCEDQELQPFREHQAYAHSLIVEIEDVPFINFTSREQENTAILL